MSKKSKQEYIAAIRARYLSSNKEEKQKLLYEICTTCGYNRKYAIPLWLPFYEGELTEENKKLLLRISPATIDRLLKPIRNRFKKKGLSTTKPGSLLKKQVPIKLNQWDESMPGFIEVDTVVHCGVSVSGQFAYTLNIVDIASGWTEQRALWGKGKL